MKVVNMTPHQITMEDGNNIPSSGVIRLREEVISETHLDGVEVPLKVKRFVAEATTPLPEVAAGTLYIVSAIVANAFPEREDFVTPETARRADGSISHCTAFVRVQ